ncbi:hypothetical protein [Rudaeicoccus suwonensis]|uniref:Uncharacterized protein n=1 Tax=Rudaeicoccus suwonensis TaxID=657409 RepID=A0A561EBW8_9MICO|nr:hypothetical protein [Rudaeicoccus suwonensis]TWE13105.1 hypothetical protein BKA23_1934 [Rudaeicoccus suwonensis]
MQLPPRYWSAARDGALLAWGWSATSIDEATWMARDRLTALLAALGSGTARASYGWVPPREELVHEVRADDGTLIGVVTRNRYGADVLGTDQLLIADVDVPRGRTGSRVRRFFGRSQPEDDPKTVALQRIQTFANTHPHLGVRVYETYGGFRAVVTGTGLAPDAPQAAEMFGQLATDEVYAHLCRKFHTCRARLTPKPWRCGMHRRPPEWPAADAAAETALSDWLAAYRTACGNARTCRLVLASGPSPNPQEWQLIDVHDRATRITDEQLPLA